MGARAGRGARRRPLLMVVALVALATSMALPAASDTKSAKATTDAVLTPGRPWFHEHPEPITATLPEEACTTETCPQFTVLIREPVWRLRVALGLRYPSADHIDAVGDPQWAPSFDLRVSPPAGGQPRYESLGLNRNGTTVGKIAAALKYHTELLWLDPPVGEWTITVIPTHVRGVGFRLRAAVEERPEPPDEPKLLLPDLRATPPFEIGFMTPTATYQPGVPAASPRLGCMAEDFEEAVLERRPAPTSCLRASLGVENAGEGPLLLNTPDSCFSSPYACLGDVPVEQWFYERHKDGGEPMYWRLSDERQPAGTGRWHATHVHLHYGQMYGARLFTVDETTRQPTLEPPGSGHKIGFAPQDEWIADWHKFDQGPIFCCNDSRARLYMSAGWGDIYEWNRSGNYIDFPLDESGLLPRPGLYVLQGETDPLGLIREADEDNNRAYALFNIDGEGGVNTLERGYGDGPWDRRKKVVEVTP